MNRQAVRCEVAAASVAGWWQTVEWGRLLCERLDAGSVTQDGPPVNAPNRQARFQFSLRKLLLWMAVWAAWLGIVRVLAPSGFYAVITTAWLLGLVLIRRKWGRLPGWGVAAFASAIALSVIFMLGALREPPGDPTPNWFYRYLSLLALLPMLLVVGGLAGICMFFPVDVVVRVVNAVDVLLARKTSPACDSSDSERRPDAPPSDD